MARSPAQLSCASCGAAADEVLLCPGCLARVHVACWQPACFVCGSSEPPLGPIRPRALRQPRRWRLRRRRVLIAGALLLGSGWLAAGRTPPPSPPSAPIAAPSSPDVPGAPEDARDATTTVSGRFVPITDEVLEQIGIDLADPLAWRGEANARCRAGDHTTALAMFDARIRAELKERGQPRRELDPGNPAEQGTGLGWVHEYKNILASRRIVQLTFSEHALAEVVTFLADMSGLNIILSPRAEADERKVTLTVQGCTLGDVIALLCEQHQLGVAYEAESLILTSAALATDPLPWSRRSLWSRGSFLPEPDPVRPATRHARAIERVHAGDYEGALEDYRLLLVEQPQDATFLAGLAWTWAQMREHEVALLGAERALEKGEPAQALHARAWARLHLGDTLGAEADIARALVRSARDAVAWELRARLDLRRGHHADAFQALTRARGHDRWRERTRALEELARELARLEHLRASKLGRLGDRRGQLAALDRVIALDPSLMWAWNDRGCVKNEMGDPAGALADCTRALELSPATAFTLNNRARARVRLGDLFGAESDLRWSLGLDPENAWAFETMAMLRLAQGRVPEAAVALARARSLDRLDERAAALRALALELERAR